MDHVDRETRSRIMASVKGKNTQLEMAMANVLDKLGLSYIYQPKLTGRPDFLVKGIVIFVDGCFWHGCPIHYKVPKSNIGFWKGKLENNISRRKTVSRELYLEGFKIMEIFGCQITEHYVKTKLVQILPTLFDNVKERGEENG